MPTENDLRAALTALAEQAPDADGVLATITTPAPRAAVTTRSGRRHAPRLLAPVAASAAAAAVIALAVGIAGRTRPNEPSGVSLSCTRPDSQCIPRYYLDIKAVIRDRVTGATVTTIRLPRRYRTIDAIAGAADDRTFVLAAQTKRAYGSYPVTLFLVRFNPARRSVTIRALPIPEIGPGPVLNGLALSPDGHELATAISTGKDLTDSALSVYSLTSEVTGRPVRVWQGPGSVGDSPYDPSGISWSSTGMLAINWVSGQGPTTGIRLLDTDAPSGSLVAHSRMVVASESTMGGAFSFAWDGVLTPDGTRIVAVLSRAIRLPSSILAQPRSSSSRPRPSTTHRVTVKPAVLQYEIEQYSASTGRPIRTLRRATGDISAVNEILEWTNSSGSVLVVAMSPGHGKPVVFGLLGGSQFRPIPDAPAPDELSVTMVF